MGFCPRCGTETDYRLCQACLREHHPLVQKIGAVGVIMCPSCMRTYSKNTWSNKSLQAVTERALERAISFTQDARIDGVIIEPVEVETGKQYLQLTVMGSADTDAQGYDEYYEVPLVVQGNLCTECQNLKNQYFTGIIQLRRPNEEVQEEIERLLGKALTSVKDVTGGIDYYVSDHRILQNVARSAHNTFGGELTVRAQHFSYDNLASKNLYRVNACLRLPKYWKGSVVQAGSKIILIKNMGRALKGIDLESGKTVSVPFHLEYPQYHEHQSTVVTTHPQITILHPETYQSVPVRNPPDDFKHLEPGNSVTIVETEKGFFIAEK